MKRPGLSGISIIACMVIFLTGILVTGPGETSAQTVTPAVAGIDSIAVIGTGPGMPSGYMDVLLSKRGGPLNGGLVSHDTEALAVFLRERGWLAAAVSASVDSSKGKIVLRFRANPGIRTFIGGFSISVDPATPLEPPIPAGFPAFRGKPFARETVEGTARSLISRLADGGFPGATVTPRLAARSDTVDVTLDVRTGERARIDSVAVRGLTVTKERVIRRETGRFIGKPVSPETLMNARSAMNGLKFLRPVSDPEIVYDDTGRAVLVMTVEETTRNSFEGVMGYQPGTGGDSGELVGKVDLGLQNLFGSGRSTRVRWESLGGDAQDMEVKWEEPWVFGFPFSLNASFLQERRTDLGYTRTVLGLGVSRSVGRLTGSAGFRSETVTGDSLTGADALGFDGSIEWSAFDNPANPRSGARYAASQSYSKKRYRYADGNASISRSTAGMEQYIPLFDTHTVAMLVSYRRVDSGSRAADVSDLWWIGGASTLRGYAERAFPAERALLATTEYRVITGGTSRIFTFIDYGRLWNTERIDTRRIMRGKDHFGYGFGFRIESAAGTLGFDYGLGTGDSPGEGKLHVRLASTF